MLKNSEQVFPGAGMIVKCHVIGAIAWAIKFAVYSANAFLVNI